MKNTTFTPTQQQIINKKFVLVKYEGKTKRAFIKEREGDDILVYWNPYSTIIKWNILLNQPLEKLSISNIIGTYSLISNINFIWR